MPSPKSLFFGFKANGGDQSSFQEKSLWLSSGKHNLVELPLTLFLILVLGYRWSLFIFVVIISAFLCVLSSNSLWFIFFFEVSLLSKLAPRVLCAKLGINIVYGIKSENYDLSVEAKHVFMSILFFYFKSILS